jgi:hypothetical protein
MNKRNRTKGRYKAFIMFNFNYKYLYNFTAFARNGSKKAQAQLRRGAPFLPLVLFGLNTNKLYL